MTLTAKDKKILACLQGGGRMSNVALKSVEEAGFVKGYFAILDLDDLDRQKLGLGIVVFAEVKG